MKAIPKSLLIHTVNMYKNENKDKWGKGEENLDTVISLVRFEPSSKIVRTVNNAEIQLSATLIYDCRNSRPKNIQFGLDDIITFNGEKHRIQLIEPLYDGNKLHHIEIGLVKQV